MPHQMWIKATLKTKGYKLKDMAQALDITAPRVTDILRGSREVQSGELATLASLLGINLKSLLASLQAGNLVEIADADDRLPVAGHIMGDGSLIPLTTKDPLKYVALPPDAETSEGLFCFVMGDNSMAQEIKAGDIIIAADPRQHFYPMVPGALFLVHCGTQSSNNTPKLAVRQFVKSDSGESWLVPLPDQPDPKLASWRFDMLPPSLSGTSENAASLLGTEIQTGETVGTEHIAAAVLWVHRRYMPQEGS